MYLNYLLGKRILKRLFLIFFLTGIILSLNNKKVYAFPFPGECSKKLNAIKNYDCEIIYQSKKGYGNALIEGMENVQTDYLCIFNADGSFDPKYLNEMMF